MQVQARCRDCLKRFLVLHVRADHKRPPNHPPCTIQLQFWHGFPCLKAFQPDINAHWRLAQGLPCPLHMVLQRQAKWLRQFLGSLRKILCIRDFYGPECMCHLEVCLAHFKLQWQLILATLNDPCGPPLGQILAALKGAEISLLLLSHSRALALKQP